jgi:hypothetical protein
VTRKRLNIWKREIRGGFLLLMGLGLTIGAQAQPAKEIAVEAVRPAKVSGFSDEGAFLLFLDGKLILTNFVKWNASGTFDSKGEGTAEGTKIRMGTSLTSDAEGFWSEVRMEMPIHTTGARRVGDLAVLTLPDGETRTTRLKPGVLPFVGMVGLNLYTRFYDEPRGGKQVLPILIPHKKATEISVERKRQFQRELAGKKLDLREFELKAGDLTAVIWIDERGRLIRSEQPDEGSTFIRQGYEPLGGDR